MDFDVKSNNVQSKINLDINNLIYLNFNQYIIIFNTL